MVRKMYKKILWFGFIIGYICIIKYCFFQLLPFLLAFLCYYMLKPVIEKIEKLCHFKRDTIQMSLFISLYLIFIVIVLFLIVYAIIYGLRSIQNISYLYQSFVEPLVSQTISWITSQFSFFSQQDYLSFIYDILLYVMTCLSTLLRYIPNFIFSLFLFMMATFFLVLEYDKIKQQFFYHLSFKTIHFLQNMKNNCLQSITLYIKCQCILMFVCFLILSFVLTILKIDHSLFIAFIISLLDSLPMIGIGIILIPWVIALLIQKCYMKAFYIFFVYLFINILRSFLEPHMMKKQTKIPSFLLLLSMVIHIYLFGFIGVILSPVHINVLYSLMQRDK